MFEADIGHGNYVHHVNRVNAFFITYTPNAAVYGEMAWEPPEVRNWESISNYWARLSSLEGHRLNKRVATWANDKSSTSCKNWFHNVKMKFVELDLNNCCDISRCICKIILTREIKQRLMLNFEDNWMATVNRNEGLNGRGRTVLVLIKLTKFAFALRLRCGSCKLIF